MTCPIRWMPALLAAACFPAAAQETAVFDSYGRVEQLVFDGQSLAVSTRLAVTLRNGTRVVTAGPGAGSSERAPGGGWQGVIEPEPGMRARVEQGVASAAGQTEITLKVNAETDLDVDGLYFVVRLPWARFAGGTAALAGTSHPLPRIKPAAAAVATAESPAVELSAPAGGVDFSAAFDRPLPVSVLDEWDLRGHSYSIWIELHKGALKQGESAGAKITLGASGMGDHKPATVTLNTAGRRYPFDGFGGNYCFSIENPTTGYTLKNMKVRWARTEMTLPDWRPDPTEALDALGRHDTPGSRLRHEFELARRIQGMGIPYVISVWRFPSWLMADPRIPPREEGQKLALSRWEDLLDTVASYLVYAKKQYGVEPGQFSFNEANIGVNLLLTPEEHREEIKAYGRRFERLGLKTKMLLGDATGPDGTHVWALAAANDPEVRRYVSAVAFHSWGGATPAQYAAWGDLADWMGLPLLVTELGVDPFAWRGGIYDSFDYGMREVRMYQEILQHARPRGTLQWEFTADYGLARENGHEVTPTQRFWLLKHFTDLTPTPAEGLETASDHPDVLMTAFGKGGALTLHIANLGASRDVTVRGLPPGKFRAVRTTETEAFREASPVEAQGGAAVIHVPARCLLTLTGSGVR